MARGDALPVEHEVTRWIKPKHLGKDDDDNVLVDGQGRPTDVFPEAFALGEDEESLSVTWLQFFAPGRVAHLPLAADAIRQSMKSKSLQPKGALAIATVAVVLEAGRDHGTKLRVLEDAVEGNDGHVEIRRYPPEMGLLQIAMAQDVFTERYRYFDVRQAGWMPPAA